MTEEKRGVVVDQTFWNNKYQTHATNWDLGSVSPPIKVYIDKIQNKASAILIPGCGNAYEAEYLVQQGFTDITIIDIAPALVAMLTKKFENNKNIRVVLGNFFAHKGKYDVILEQTFFCALEPAWRQKYVWKMHQLLSENGILFGLLFNRSFEVSPPFGGHLKDYELLFKESFNFKEIGVAENSIGNRAHSELFFEFKKNNFYKVNLYLIKGITGSEYNTTVIQKLLEIEGLKNASLNTAFSELLVVSKVEIAVKKLQEMISDDKKFNIRKALS
jgi:SAM-dependent methyltransferase